jgi:hypothetical protein
VTSPLDQCSIYHRGDSVWITVPKKAETINIGCFCIIEAVTRSKRQARSVEKRIEKEVQFTQRFFTPPQNCGIVSGKQTRLHVFISLNLLPLGFWLLLSFFTYPFLIHRSLSLLTVITNLHFFLSPRLLHSLVADLWMSYACRCLNPLWESQNTRTHYQKCFICMIWKNPIHLSSLTKFCGTPGQNPIKPTNPGLSRKKRHEWDAHIFSSSPDSSLVTELAE